MSVEGNYVAIGIDPTPLNRGLDQAHARVEQTMQSAAGVVDRGSSAIGQLFAGLLAGFSLHAVTKTIESIASIEDAAKKAGLSLASFQELAGAVAIAGGKVDQTTAALKRFSLGMAEVHARHGEFYEFLKKNVPELERELRATNSQEEALGVLSSALARLSTDQERALLSQKAFGAENEKLTGVLKGGVAALEEAKQKSRELGLVMSDELVANTAEADKALNTLAVTLKAKAYQAVAELIPEIKMLSDLLSQMPTLGDLKLQFGGTTKELGAIQRRFFTLHNEYVALKEELEKPPELRTWEEAIRNATGGAARRYATVQAELVKLRDELDKFAMKNKAPEDTGSQVFDEQKITDDVLRIKRAVEGMKPWQVKIDFTVADKLDKLRERAFKANGEFLDQVRAQMERELREFDRLLRDKKISEADYLAARETLNAEAGAKIVRQMQKEAKAVGKTWDEVIRAIEGPLDSALGNAFRGRKVDVKDFFVELVAGINQAIVKALILKPILDAIRGFLGGYFGALGGGGGGGGGINGGAGAQMGPAFGAQFGQQFGAQRQQAGPPAPQNIYHVDARGADAGVEQRVYAAMAEIERKRPSPQQAVADYARRFPARAS